MAEKDLLKDRPFLMLLLGRFLAIMASVAAPSAVAFGVLASPGGTPTRLSIVMACESVPMLAFMLAGGVVADRYRRNRVIVVGLALSASSFTMIGIILVSGWLPWWASGICAAAAGIGLSIMNPALAGIVPQLVAAKDLHAANNLIGLVRNTARILGVMVAGVLVAAVGGGRTLIACGAAFVIAAVPFALLSIRVPRGGPREANSFVRDLRDGWKEFTKREWLWVVVLQSSLHFMAYEAAVGVIGPALANAELGGAKPWSWIVACESAGMFAGVLVAMKWKPRRTILAGVLATALTMPTPFILLGVGAPVVMVMGAMVLNGMGMSMIAVLWATTVQVKVPSHALSRVSAYDALGSNLMAPAGLLLAGPAIAVLGTRGAILASGGMLLVVTLFSLLSRDVRVVRVEPNEKTEQEVRATVSVDAERDD
ncbi:MFS transporter [Amycolatopsis sp. NPDC051102]|uniref:MFS transporter n=1 Tax=Amycolatopsis sp. NPDC051102 TaxID=3155163 RepID=UPI0034353677